MSLLRTSIFMFLVLSLLTGVAYPLLITAISQLAFHSKANGSLVLSEGKVIGSELIAQKFTGPAYFWPRPSEVDYDPIKPAGGSNLGPTSRKLKEAVKERLKKIAASHQVDASLVPADLVYGSGSGLDPHIKLQSAFFQLDRVASARKLSPEDKEKLKSFISNHAQGIVSEYVNVFVLNYEIDKQFTTKR